jgi:Zn-dependent protease with chaperone function
MAAHRASLLYRLGLVVAALGTIVTGAILIDVLRAVDVQGAHAEHLRLLGQSLTAPAINLAAAVMLPLAAVGIVSLVLGLRAALAEVIAQRRFLRGLVVVGRLPAHPDVLVVRDPRLQAFCAGQVRPRVFVSTATARALEPAELDAVLAHEAQHRLRRDPLRIAAARALCEALFFLPVLRRLTERYCALAELSADAAALKRSGGDPAPLASAMLQFGGAVDPAVVGIAPERVDHLLGATPAWRLPSALLVCAVTSIATMALLAWQIGRSALITTSLNPPLLSSQPCVVVLAGVPFLLAAAALWLIRRA